MHAAGAFRRAIVIRGHGDRVVADLEDDFHRFGVTVTHDGHRVVRLEARAVRYPWATCLEAPAALAALEGTALSAHPAALFRQADPRLHCTHLFELAALALSQAARGDGARRFEAEVTDFQPGPPDGRHTARLFEDGVLVLEWRLAGDVITQPAEYAGRSAASFGSRALADFEPGQAERLMILRRAVQTARGRGMDVDAFPTAAAMGRRADCYSLQPANAARARRVIGSIREWPDRQSLLASVSSDSSS